VVADIQTLAMPDDPSLAAWASVQSEAGHCATVLDSQWRYAFVAVDEKGVRVRNYLLRRVFPLSNVDRFDWEERQGEQLNFRVCVVVLRDGTTQDILALSTRNSAAVTVLNNRLRELKRD
jgi:hypothetical protein